MTEAEPRGGADSLDWIDPVIHSPSRLKLMVELYVVEAADAAFLVNRTGLTWGNLSTPPGKLEESGYVEVEKGYDGKKPRTMIELTDRGRAAFREYRANMHEGDGGAPGRLRWRPGQPAPAFLRRFSISSSKATSSKSSR